MAVDAQLEEEIRRNAHAGLFRRHGADVIVAAGARAIAGAHGRRIGVVSDARVERASLREARVEVLQDGDLAARAVGPAGAAGERAHAVGKAAVVREAGTELRAIERRGRGDAVFARI